MMNREAEAKRAADVKKMTEAMRAMNPERFDAAAASVRKNMQAAIKYTPELFTPVLAKDQQ